MSTVDPTDFGKRSRSSPMLSEAEGGELITSRAIEGFYTSRLQLVACCSVRPSSWMSCQALVGCPSVDAQICGNR